VAGPQRAGGARATLARAGSPNVLVSSANPYIGGAAVSRQLYKDSRYSNCSYVCSLLRTEIIRALDLPRHGLQIIPYDGGCTLNARWRVIWRCTTITMPSREISRHSEARRPKRTIVTLGTCCDTAGSSKPLLLESPPDPTSFKPRDLMELLYLGKALPQVGEAQMYDTLRFWTMSCADLLDRVLRERDCKGASSPELDHWYRPGTRSPGTAYVLLHQLHGQHRRYGCAWGFARAEWEP